MSDPVSKTTDPLDELVAQAQALDMGYGAPQAEVNDELGPDYIADLGLAPGVTAEVRDGRVKIKTARPDRYVMALCGDCSSGPPCRCSDDPAVVTRVRSDGRWEWVATCVPKEIDHAG